MKTLRVVMIGPFPHELTRIDGGVAAATTYVSQALARQPGIELIGIRIAAGQPTECPSNDLGWPIANLELGRFSVSTLFRRQMRQFESLLQQFRPDLIHAQGADVSGYLAIKSGYPAVVTIHGILTECARLRVNLVKRLRELAQAQITERFVIGRARHIVAISPYVASYYKNRLRGTLHYVPNAVAPTYFDLNRKPEQGRFLYAGRISQGKGLIDLVQAVAQVPHASFRLILAGAAPDRVFESQLRAAIVKSGQEERMAMTGLLDEPSILSEFARASALVLPSYQETAPMVIQQAMAAGLPVIATRVGGVPDLIEHGVSGLLFEPGDIGELGRLLQTLYEDSDLAERLAATAQAKAAELFTAEKVASTTRAIYQRVLAAG